MQILLLGLPENKSLQDLKKILVGLGHTVTFLRTLSEKHRNFVDNFRQIKNLIIASDAIITDSSTFDFEVEFTLGLTVELEKSVLIVYSKGSDRIDMYKETDFKNVVFHEYDNGEELKKVLIGFIQKIADYSNAKLFMVIPSHVNKYLDWMAANSNLNKSEVVRSAVEKAAKQNKEYQGFLKDLKDSFG